MHYFVLNVFCMSKLTFPVYINISCHNKFNGHIKYIFLRLFT